MSARKHDSIDIRLFPARQKFELRGTGSAEEQDAVFKFNDALRTRPTPTVHQNLFSPTSLHRHHGDKSATKGDWNFNCTLNQERPPANEQQFPGSVEFDPARTADCGRYCRGGVCRAELLLVWPHFGDLGAGQTSNWTRRARP
jgi:hypothetical protein